MNAGYPTMLLIPGMSAFQRVNEPASGLAGRMFFQVHCPHGKTGPDVGLHLHVQRNPFSRCESFLDHWQRHITPPVRGAGASVQHSRHLASAGCR